MDVKFKIKKLKKDLEKSIETWGIDSMITIIISQELDKEINEFYRKGETDFS